MYFVHHNDFGVPGASLEFLEKRLLRIVPIYRLLTTLAAAAILAVPNLMVTHGSEISLSWIASSYLFLPMASRGSTISPIIGVGWTLDYEMLFYLIFAGALFLSLRRGLLAIGALFVSAVGIGAIIIRRGHRQILFRLVAARFPDGRWYRLVVGHRR